jgi:hypothetical protein
MLESSDASAQGWPEGLTARQIAFLDRYSEVGNVLDASSNVCHRCSHYEWLRTSDVYRKTFITARSLFSEFLIREAFRLAIHGEEIPVLRNGKAVLNADGSPVTRPRRNFGLLKFLIKLNQDSVRSKAGSEAEFGQSLSKSDTFDHKSSKPDYAAASTAAIKKPDTSGTFIPQSQRVTQVEKAGPTPQPTKRPIEPPKEDFVPRRLRRALARKAGKGSVAIA